MTEFITSIDFLLRLQRDCLQHQQQQGSHIGGGWKCPREAPINPRRFTARSFASVCSTRIQGKKELTQESTHNNIFISRTRECSFCTKQEGRGGNWRRECKYLGNIQKIISKCQNVIYRLQETQHFGFPAIDLGRRSSGCLTTKKPPQHLLLDPFHKFLLLG